MPMSAHHFLILPIVLCGVKRFSKLTPHNVNPHYSKSNAIMMSARGH